MPDLRDRFAGLDAAPAPDLWPDVVRRAAALQPDVVAIPVRRDRPVPLRLGGLPALALLALLLVVALVGGVLVAGGYVRGPFLGVAPSPSNAQATPTLAATVTPRPTEAHGPAAGKIPPCDPASTGLAEIVDGSTGSAGPVWIAGDARAALPLLIDSADLAVIGSLVDGPRKAIYVLQTTSDDACVLAEVPVRLEVTGLTWSPLGDALAIS